MKVVLVSGKARNGKDLASDIIKSELELDGGKVFRVAYADYLKDICKRLAGWDGVEKPRELLQQLGTDIVREKLHMKNLWVNHVVNEIKIAANLGYTHAIVTDCRFKNEIYIPKAEFDDCVSVRVERIGFNSELTESQKQHKSETELDDFKFDVHIKAMEGIGNLRSVILSKMNYLK